MLALALLGCSSTRDFNALPYGAVLLGLAGITFHLSQLHVSNLFPAQPRPHLQPAGGRLHRLRHPVLLPGPHFCGGRQHPARASLDRCGL